MNTDKVKHVFLNSIIYKMTSKELEKWGKKMLKLSEERKRHETIAKIHEQHRDMDPQLVEQLYDTNQLKLIKDHEVIITCGRQRVVGENDLGKIAKVKEQMIEQGAKPEDIKVNKTAPYTKMNPYHREQYFDYWNNKETINN